MSDLTIKCDCEQVAVRLSGPPRVRAICHCRSCQDLYNVPFNMIAAWENTAATIAKGEATIGRFQYPGKQLVRFWCRECGSVIFNTNRYGFTVVPQVVLRKAHGGTLPDDLAADKHLFYADRVVSIADDLPKYLEGVDGPLLEQS